MCHTRVVALTQLVFCVERTRCVCLYHTINLTGSFYSQEELKIMMQGEVLVFVA